MFEVKIVMAHGKAGQKLFFHLAYRLMINIFGINIKMKVAQNGR